MEENTSSELNGYKRVTLIIDIIDLRPVNNVTIILIDRFLKVKQQSGR